MNREELRKELNYVVPEFYTYAKVEAVSYAYDVGIIIEMLEDKVISQQETIDLLFKDIDANLEETEGLHKRIEELQTKLHEISEEYIGMDGFEPKTAPEAYQQNLLKRMYEITK